MAHDRRAKSRHAHGPGGSGICPGSRAGAKPGDGRHCAVGDPRYHCLPARAEAIHRRDRRWSREGVMAGIIAVAKKAGVSITTASRVLNNVDYPVAAATRRRVEEAARQLQYSPSALARALVTRRSGIVGVLAGDTVDPYFAEIARGVEDTARRAGYLVVVCNTDREPETERRYVSTLADYRVDALIFVGGDIVAPREQRKLKQQLRLASKAGTLAAACAGEHAGLPTIDIDHHAAA